MTDIPKLSEKHLPDHGNLYAWCLTQAADRYMGTLSQEKIDKLNSVNFSWEHYESELDKLGFDWEKNKKEKK